MPDPVLACYEASNGKLSRRRRILVADARLKTLHLPHIECHLGRCAYKLSRPLRLEAAEPHHSGKAKWEFCVQS